MTDLINLIKKVIPQAIECAKRVVGKRTRFAKCLIKNIMPKNWLSLECHLQTLSGMWVTVRLFYQGPLASSVLDEAHVTFNGSTWGMQFDGMLSNKHVLIS